jgi:hypothetical protein
MPHAQCQSWYRWTPSDSIETAARSWGNALSPSRSNLFAKRQGWGVHVDSGIQLPLDRVHVIGLCCNAQTFLTPANPNLTVRYVGCWQPAGP